LAALIASLDALPSLLAAAIAAPDGTLRQAMRIEAVPGTILPPRPIEAVWAVREGNPAVPSTTWRFLAADGREIARTETPVAIDDPRSMTWTLQARAPGVHISTLYDLPFIGLPGLSVSAPLADGSGVIDFDLTLDTLGGFLRRQVVSPHG